MDATGLALNIVLFGGLFTLAAGYYLRDRRCHLLRIVGFVLLTVFFTLEVVRIVREGKDVWNVAFTAFAPPIFVFVAWQEYLSYLWNEDHRSLRWLTGTAWMAGLIYYGFDRIPVMTAGIIYVVAGQTIWLGQMFGYGADFRIEGINWEREDLSVSITNSPVSIILGCTGIEAIVIFVGAILATRLELDPWAAYREADAPKFVYYRLMSGKERMARALIYTISIIWVGNLIRNVAIIYLVDVKGWDFDFVHGDLGKGSSFVILLVLAFVTFNLLPEMLDNISGLYDLRNRLSPEERAAEAAKVAAEKARKEAEERKGEGQEGDELEGEDRAREDDAREGDGTESLAEGAGDGTGPDDDEPDDTGPA
jgi:exosortase/archaeosortase family protein